MRYRIAPDDIFVMAGSVGGVAMVLTVGWYKVQYSFDVFEFEGARDYSDERIRAYVPTLLDSGVSPYPEVGDVGYAGNYGWYYVGVANKGYWINEPSWYGPQTWVQTSTQYVAHRNEVVDAISDPDFSPYATQGGFISVTLTNDNSGVSGMDFTVEGIGYQWFYGTVDLVDEDGDGKDDRGQQEQCPGQQGLTDRQAEIEAEFGRENARFERASDNLKQAEAYLASATDTADYAKYSQYVNSVVETARLAVDTLATFGFRPASWVSQGVDLTEAILSEGASVDGAAMAENFKDLIMDSFGRKFDMLDAFDQAIVDPAFLAKDYMDWAKNLSERQRFLDQARDDVQRAQKLVDDYRNAQADAAQKRDDLVNALRDLIDCDQWSDSGSAMRSASAAASSSLRKSGGLAVLMTEEGFSGHLDQLADADTELFVAQFGAANDRVVLTNLRNLEIYGGAGTDTAIFNLQASEIALTYASNGSLFVIFKNGSQAALYEFESIRTSDAIFTQDENGGHWRFRGGSGVDLLNGSDGRDALFGFAGADVLTGGAGSDILDGGTDADRMVGGTGDDIYYVDNSRDVVVESRDEGFDQIFSSASYSLGGRHVEVLTLTGTADLSATGNSLKNVLIGNAGNNVLKGLAGDDYLDGGKGQDELIGGAGNDVYIVDNGRDVVIELAGEGLDEVRTGLGGYALASEVENLTGTNDAGQRLTGNRLDNVIIGADGNDLIRGLAGNDILTGNGGADRFRFDTPLGTTNRDKITDFTPGVDKIELSSSIFKAIGGLGSLSPDMFRAGSFARDADEHILYNVTRGGLYYDVDGSGSAAPILFAYVTPGLSLSASDFVVV